MNGSWISTLRGLFLAWDRVSPRGMLTIESLQHTVAIDMRKPVLTVKERKLNYRFMAAEAYWILSGSDKVEHISPWNKNIAKFSDDGDVFFGAYGPKIMDQLPYVVRKLAEDPSSRQAGLTIWREKPPATLDVPCTVAMFASIRGDKLNLSVYMRSSDVWLGLPYDVFNFSMVAHLICGMFRGLPGALEVSPGTLYLTAASSHLYEAQWSEAKKIAFGPQTPGLQPDTPEEMFTDPLHLLSTLKVLRESSPGSSERWWDNPYRLASATR
jgi:thymidylate synthase